MVRTLAMTFLAVTSLAACSSKKKSPPSPTPTAGATVVDAAVPAGPDAAAAEPVAEPVAVPKDVPPFGKVAGADPTRAQELVHEARQALDGGDGDPTELALAAVKADPGSAAARATLASTIDDEAFALAQLTPLTTATAADCPDCADTVRNLLMSDWPDAVKALAAKVTPSPQRAAAEAVIAFLGDGDATKVAPYFKGAKIAYTVVCSVCDEDSGGDTKKKLSGAKLLAELGKTIAAAKAEEMNGYYVGDDLTCAKNCCTVDIGMLQHNTEFFDSVCFTPGTDQVSSLSIVSGG